MRTPETFKKPEVIVDIQSPERHKTRESERNKLDIHKINSERQRLESDARFEAIELAKTSSEQKHVIEADKSEKKTAEHISRKASFNKTMADIRFEMTESQRLGSKIIHNEIIEKVSEVAGKTLFRPLPILFGGLFAFIFSLVIYFIAKNIGFELSGFESILGFLVGWTVGIVIDYLRVISLGRSR